MKSDWEKIKNRNEIYHQHSSLEYITTPDLQSLDSYTMECVRDLIYWWFKFTGKKLSKKRKDRIAKLVLKNFNRVKYASFIDYGFNYKYYLKELIENNDNTTKNR